MKHLLQKLKNISLETISHPFLWGTGLLVVYLLLFQRGLVFSGDMWAEMSVQYLRDAISSDWSYITDASSLGYLMVLSSLIPKLYVVLGFPLGYIDVFVRLVSILYVVLSLGFITHKTNRTVIKHDFLRILLAFTMLASLYHVSMYSFINVIYVGFIPMIFVCLGQGPKKLGSSIAYVLFSVLQVLSKPSVFMLPFLIYHTVKTKKYVVNALIIAAVCYQTYWTFFTEKSVEVKNTNIVQIIGDMVIGTGTLLLKLFQIPPVHILLPILLGIIFGVITTFLLVRKKVWEVLLILFGLGISIYAYRLHISNYWENFFELYTYIFKTQREILIYFFLLLAIFFAAGELFMIFKNKKKVWSFVLSFFTGFMIFFGYTFHIVDVEGAAVESHIEAFREDITKQNGVCILVPPTPFWSPQSYWRFSNYERYCMVVNRELIIGKDTFDIFLPKEGLVIDVAGVENHELKNLTVLIRNEEYVNPAKLSLEDRRGNVLSEATIIPKREEQFSFVQFNLSGLEMKDFYSFVINYEEKSDLSHKLFLGRFKDNAGTVIYPIFSPIK